MISLDAGAAVDTGATSAAGAAVNALADRYWEGFLELNPEIGTPFSCLDLGSIVSAVGTGLILQYYLEPAAVDPELLPRVFRRLLGLPPRTPPPA
jgi:hypothetical protein